MLDGAGHFERMNRKHVLPADCVEEPLPDIVRAGYDALSSPVSFAVPKLEQIQEKATTWLPVTALAKNAFPAAFSLMLDVHGTGNMDKLPTCWHAYFPVRSDVVRHVSSGATYVVLDTCRFAFLGVACELKRSAGRPARCRIRSEEVACRPRWIRMDDCTQWECFETVALPPIARLAEGASPEIVINAVGPSALTRRAALVGFKHVPAMYIKKMALQWGVQIQGKRPKALIGAVIALIACFVPNVTQQQMDAALESRTHVGRSKSVLSASSELVDSTLDPSDKALLRESEEMSAKQAGATERTKVAIGLGSKYLESLGLQAKKATKAKPAQQRKVVKHQVVWTKVADVKAAQALMPQVAGACIQCVVPKRCWTAYYPNCAPASRTRT